MRASAVASLDVYFFCFCCSSFFSACRLKRLPLSLRTENRNSVSHTHLVECYEQFTDSCCCCCVYTKCHCNIFLFLDVANILPVSIQSTKPSTSFEVVPHIGHLLLSQPYATPRQFSFVMFVNKIPINLVHFLVTFRILFYVV